MLARTHPAAGPSGSRTTNTGGRARMAGSNSGSSEWRYPHTRSVCSPPPPCRTTGMSSHGGRSSRPRMETASAGVAPPIVYSSAYGSTMTSPAWAQWRTPSATDTQHEPLATMWNRIMRSAPGRSRSASASGADSNENASVSSDRKKSAPSSRSCASVERSSSPAGAGSSVITSTATVDIAAARNWCRGYHARCLRHGGRERSHGYSIYRHGLAVGHGVQRRRDLVQVSTIPPKQTEGTYMRSFPPLTHVALTVRDLSASVPWYESLFGSPPVIDEDTDPDMHHTVYLVGNNTLIGLHQHRTPAPDETFSEYRVGLDHVAFGCSDHSELEEWVLRLDELGIAHGNIKD